MKSVSNWLPLPIWVIIAMFVIGIGAGFGLALIIAEKGLETPAASAPWNDQGAKLAKTPVPVADPPPPPNVEKVLAAVPPQDKVPPKTDERWLGNMINSPVKRAMQKAVGKLEAKLVQCRAELARPGRRLPARVELEAIGGMATVLEIEIFAADPGPVQSCLRRRTSQLLIDFPVEDGSYEMLVTFTDTK